MRFLNELLAIFKRFNYLYGQNNFKLANTFIFFPFFIYVKMLLHNFKSLQNYADNIFIKENILCIISLIFLIPYFLLKPNLSDNKYNEFKFKQKLNLYGKCCI